MGWVKGMNLGELIAGASFRYWFFSKSY
jgi:hypothetical protein